MPCGYLTCGFSAVVSIAFCIHMLLVIGNSSTERPVKDAEETEAVDLAALLDAGEGATVTLVAGDTRLVAHRAVLAASSPVFAAMLHIEVPEAGSAEIRITDVQGQVLRRMLAYAYTLRVPQPPDLTSELLAAANKYGLSGLRARCEQQLAAQLTVENAAATAVLAVSHCYPSLAQAAVTFVKAHTHRVMATKGWAHAVINHPHTVVQFTRLIAEPSSESSTAGPHCQPHSQTPAAAAPSTADHRTPPPDEAAVSLLRRLPGKEKGRRLIQAAQTGAVEQLQALLAAEVDVEETDRDWWTALHWTAARGDLGAAWCLLRAGARVDAIDFRLRTPLHLATSMGRADVVWLLIAYSADTSHRDALWRTPLHIAAFRGRMEVVSVLLEAGANRMAVDRHGHTPLDIARLYNHQQLAEMLS